ncbi:hypothetical protein [Vibrio hangzhouensis]|uniref:Uncharacterized protein n=1 Tax=Vibrio hangzhouensis TaxID=462991 RepID=A0A1H6C520_9VIBR|nr:hypothetical protein [Vibrio hangzhouensis]SEG68071.1 hypothetical protein SAMN04488244_13126 [Vibrio hangzhouensis]
MKTEVKLFHCQSDTPLARLSLEFYQVNMLLDEIQCSSSYPHCEVTRIEVFESGHLVRSVTACLTPELENLFERF